MKHDKQFQRTTIALSLTRLPFLTLMMLTGLYVANIAGQQNVSSYGLGTEVREFVVTSEATLPAAAGGVAASVVFGRTLSDLSLAIAFESTVENRLGIGIHDPLGRLTLGHGKSPFTNADFQSGRKIVALRSESPFWDLGKSEIARLLGADDLMPRSEATALPQNAEYVYTYLGTRELQGRYVVAGEQPEVDSFVNTLRESGYSVSEIQPSSALLAAFSDRAGSTMLIMCIIAFAGTLASWIAIFARNRTTLKRLSMMGATRTQGGLSLVPLAVKTWMWALTAGVAIVATLSFALVTRYGVSFAPETLLAIPVALGVDALLGIMLAFIVGFRLTKVSDK